MRYLCWICWLFWAGLPTLTAYPVSSTSFTDLQRIHASSHWQHYWIQYTIGLLSVTATAFTLVGCLCCRRHKRPKGFQEFKNGNTVGQESRFEPSMEGLELDVPRMLAVSDRIQFEPLPVDRIICGSKTSKPKSLPLSTSFYEERDSDSTILREPCHEWFDAEELYVPREKLKYLREIGHGWFGKVVEGRADLKKSEGASKNGGVVVRILTEEATSKEKAWFLGEATPYLKLRHQNVLALLGFCLETDPYLLLFESCPVGDLKGFLLSNRDEKSQEALKKENVLIRMALDIAAGLQHMHNHGFAHTDLSARNCLVASDLSAKLGDYGIGVEKYPEDYYVVGDRALPIRWSAPESLECTDTTIETREITSYANMWSYAILLWEIATWGDRPYDDMSDEQIIEMLLSVRTDLLLSSVQTLQNNLVNCPPNMLQVFRMCLNLNVKSRPHLAEVRLMLLSEQTGYIDFEQRWENLRTNAYRHHVRSASLQDLRGSIDSDYWTTIVDDTSQDALRSSFRLGLDEPVKNAPGIKTVPTHDESGSETEEESWKGRVEQGIYTEKVRQKSKSVTDLMVLVHIDFDSDAEASLGAQIAEKHVKKKLSTTGSDSDLRHNVHSEKFDETLRKLRDPLPNNTSSKIKSLENSERPKLLTLTMDQGNAPILRLSLDDKEIPPEVNPAPVLHTNMDSTRSDKHVLRLLSKGDPDCPLLRYVPDDASSSDIREDELLRQNNLVDVNLWNHVLDTALEMKTPGFSDHNEFGEYIDPLSGYENDVRPELVATTVSAPNTPEGREECTVCNANDDLSHTEDLDTEQKGLPNEEEEERKQLSTPDDEQSSDSGFRDKESCEEEENICSTIVPTSSSNASTVTHSICPEEEQLQILLELDTILDAEYYATLPGPENRQEELLSTTYMEKAMMSHFKPNDSNSVFTEASTDQLENLSADVYHSISEEIPVELQCDVQVKEKVQIQNMACDTEKLEAEISSNINLNIQSTDSDRNDATLLLENKDRNIRQDVEQYPQEEYENENEDEDSSTMSLRSDNSYVSFGMEEEFVTAIRNELREKLPRAQMSVVEPLETHDDENPSISSDTDVKRWDDEDSEESSNQASGGVDISIRYNIYGTPLSPILEERESTVTSESLMSNSRDASIASKESGPSDDVLLVDTRTNRMILLEGLADRLQDDDRDTTNGDISEEETMDYSCSITRPRDEKPHMMITSGGAPLPSPEEESKWQQLPSSFPLPLPFPLQDDLMSTSFATDRGWGSQDEDEDDEEEDEEDEDEGNSSSSGEFVWKGYDKPHAEQIQIGSALGNDDVTVTDADVEDEMDAEDEEEEEEFTPSAWNATLAPHRSALRSPDKTLKSGDQKKSVWFKKQRYHCVYEYPKETLATDGQGEATTTWEPTSYADWEEMMDEPRLDLYPLDYDDANHTGNEEFFVSSSNRPFEFQTGDSKYVSQFFPGACSASPQEEQRDEVDSCGQVIHQNNVDFLEDYAGSQQPQLGKLRHTRDRLKLNLSSTNGTTPPPFVPSKPPEGGDLERSKVNESLGTMSPNSEEVTQDQRVLPTTVDDNTLPTVPHEEVQCQTGNDAISAGGVECDNRDVAQPTEEYSVSDPTIDSP
ncbi:hypothetical protein KM043_018733 [Ampulex compressa]|nr:hypothetical protein KM043_018733 [Ampulex compressa]